MVEIGPGSAVHRYALHRVRDARVVSMDSAAPSGFRRRRHWVSLRGMTGSFARLALAAALTAFAVEPAAAHHVMGRMPMDFFEGLVSGLGHPIFGFDHLAAVVAVGCLAALQPRGAVLAIGYVLALILGVVTHLGGVAVPGTEYAVALSVVALGALLIRARPSSLAVLAGLFTVTGLIHGNALGESIIGAERAPLLAYLLGLALIQSALALAVIAGARWLFTDRLRLVGAGLAGVGVTVLAQLVIPAA